MRMGRRDVGAVDTELGGATSHYCTPLVVVLPHQVLRESRLPTKLGVLTDIANGLPGVGVGGTVGPAGKENTKSGVQSGIFKYHKCWYMCDVPDCFASLIAPPRTTGCIFQSLRLSEANYVVWS